MRFSLLVLGVIFTVVIFQSPLVTSLRWRGSRGGIFGGNRGNKVKPGSGTSGGNWNKGGSSGGNWNKGGSSGSGGNWNKGGSSGSSGGSSVGKGGSSGTSGNNRWGTGGSSGTSGNNRWGTGGSSGTSGNSRWGKGGSSGTSGNSRWGTGGSSGTSGNSRWGTGGNKGSGTGTGVGTGTSANKWATAKTKLTAADRFGSNNQGTSGGMKGLTAKEKWGSAAERAKGPKSAWPDVVKQAKEQKSKKVSAMDRVKGIGKGLGNMILQATVESLISEAISAGFTAAGLGAKAKGQSTTGVVPTPSCSEADKTVYTKVAIYHLSDNCTGKGAKMTQDERTKFMMAAIVNMCANPKSAVPNCQAKSKPDESSKPDPTNPPPVTCADADMFRNVAIYQMSDNCDGTGKKYTKQKYDQEVTNSITFLCQNPDKGFPNCPAKCPLEKTWESLGKHELSDACKGTGKNMKRPNYALVVLKLIDKMCALNPNPDTVRPDCST